MVSVDLCFDIINYHLYSNDASTSTNNQIATVGVSPELSGIGKIADDFIAMAKKHANDMPVWVTETGYDVGNSPPACNPYRLEKFPGYPGRLEPAHGLFICKEKNKKMCLLYVG
jgi:hypothetical protein